MTSSTNPINNEYIDGEVLALLKRMPGLTTESIYYELGHISSVLLFASIKRLQKTGVIGFCLVDDNSFPLGECETIDAIPPGGVLSKNESNFPGGMLRVKACHPRGTAKTKYEYYSVYLDNTEIAYLGGGNTDTPLAQRRKAEFEQLVKTGIIHADLPVEEIKRLVRGIQCRNMRM
jgi:hypothetical protein